MLQSIVKLLVFLVYRFTATVENLSIVNVTWLGFIAAEMCYSSYATDGYRMCLHNAKLITCVAKW